MPSFASPFNSHRNEESWHAPRRNCRYGTLRGQPKAQVPAELLAWHASLEERSNDIATPDEALAWASETTPPCSQAQEVRCRGLGRRKTAQNPCIVWGFNLTSFAREVQKAPPTLDATRLGRTMATQITFHILPDQVGPALAADILG